MPSTLAPSTPRLWAFPKDGVNWSDPESLAPYGDTIPFTRETERQAHAMLTQSQDLAESLAQSGHSVKSIRPAFYDVAVPHKLISAALSRGSRLCNSSDAVKRDRAIDMNDRLLNGHLQTMEKQLRKKTEQGRECSKGGLALDKGARVAPGVFRFACGRQPPPHAALRRDRLPVRAWYDSEDSEPEV